MEFVKSFKKIRKLKFRRINGKSAVLFLLNRKISALADGRKDFGELVDLKLDKQARSISFDLIRDDQISSVSILDYRFIASKGQSCLTWSSMDFEGPARQTFKNIFRGIDRIEVSKRYISILEAVT